MNLNRHKKGFSHTNPEKGLHSLAGAQKNEKRPPRAPTIRVGGTYIPAKDYGIPKVFGIAALAGSFISTICMAIPASKAALANEDPVAAAMTAFILGAIFVHVLSIFAESVKGAEVPLGRKAMKSFWVGVMITVFLSIFF